MGAWLDGLCSSHGHILDLGTGTGLIAAGLEELGRRVVGVDLSCPMLDQAWSKLRSPLLVQAEAGSLPCRSDAFPFAIAVLFFHLVADRQPVLGEVARVLQRGGRLIVTPVQPHRPADVIGAYDWDNGGEQRMGVQALIDDAAAAGLRFVAVEMGPRLEATMCPNDEADRREQLWKMEPGSLTALRRLPNPHEPVHRDLTQWAAVFDT